MLRVIIFVEVTLFVLRVGNFMCSCLPTRSYGTGVQIEVIVFVVKVTLFVFQPGVFERKA